MSHPALSAPEIVSPEWLADNLGNVVVLDASWHMPDTGRDADVEFLSGHIPGAQRFRIDEVADTSSPLPHTKPSAEAFAQAVAAMGVSNGSDVVIYEAGAPFAAPRAVWMFRAMGHNAKLLDGGFARWQAGGHPVESGAPAGPAKGDFTARPAGLFVNADTVAAALAAGDTVVDVRAANRFAGSVPEPRPGIRAGHMPGAKNLHYAMLVDENGSLKPDDEIAQIVKDAGIDASKPIITSCGSGVTAAILALALARQGTEVAVYDGSWTEWGGDHARPVVTSEGTDSSGG